MFDAVPVATHRSPAFQAQDTTIQLWDKRGKTCRRTRISESDIMAHKTILCLVFLAAMHAAAAQEQLSNPSQSTPPSAPSDDWHASLASMKEILAEQTRELAAQRQLLADQQVQISELQTRLSGSRLELSPAQDQESTDAIDAAKLRAGIALLTRSALISKRSTAQPSAERAAIPGETTGDTPLSIRFGHGSMTPGGWVDFTAYYRSTNVGSGLGTAFASIPFGDTVAGGLSETRFTAQSSRISVKADEEFGATRVFGYAEADFNGYLPANAYVSTNSNSLRLRVYFTNLSRGRWEFLGGQSWSLLTPNRVGVSPFLSEIYNTMHLDSNYQVGLIYARQAQLRAVYHVTPHLVLGFSTENPEQFTGSAVTFPALFSTSQADLGSSSGGGTATPALHPDLIAKLSADGRWGQRPWHAEVAGLLTPVAITTPASVTQTRRAKDIREGSGITAAVNFAVLRNLHLIATGFWSDGGGRYIGGLGPAFVVAQSGTVNSPFSAELIHSGSTITALEWQATCRTLFSFTYSGAYFDRVFSADPSTGKLVGYGFVGSANSNNRALLEATFASQTTLWKHPTYGAVQIITQASHVQRSPWYVTPLGPRNAHVFEGYANLRYVLP